MKNFICDYNFYDKENYINKRLGFNIHNKDDVKFLIDEFIKHRFVNVFSKNINEGITISEVYTRCTSYINAKTEFLKEMISYIKEYIDELKKNDEENKLKPELEEFFTQFILDLSEFTNANSEFIQIIIHSKDLADTALKVLSPLDFPLVSTVGINEFRTVNQFKVAFGRLSIPVTGIIDSKVEFDTFMTENINWMSRGYSSDINRGGLDIYYTGYNKDDVEFVNPILMEIMFKGNSNGMLWDSAKEFDKISEFLKKTSEREPSESMKVPRIPLIFDHIKIKFKPIEDIVMYSVFLANELGLDRGNFMKEIDDKSDDGFRISTTFTLNPNLIANNEAYSELESLFHDE